MKAQYLRSSKTCLLLGISVLPSWFLAGCNDSSGGPVPLPTTSPTTAPTAAPNASFAGTYRGNFTGTNTGTVEFVVNADNSINGTLVSQSLVSALMATRTASLTPRATATPTSTFTGTGQVTNGNFTVTFPVSNFSVTFEGRLVRSGNIVVGQNLTWRSTNGQNGTFTLQTVIGGNPTPTATPIGGGGTGNCTTGTGSATFSNALAASADVTPISNGCANGAITSANNRPISATVAFADARNGKARSVSLTIIDAINGVAAGRSYNVSTSNIAIYNETNASDNKTAQWSGRSGSVKVISLQGNDIQIQFDVNYGPSTIVPPGGVITAGLGTFNLKGSATVKLN